MCIIIFESHVLVVYVCFECTFSLGCLSSENSVRNSWIPRKCQIRLMLLFLQGSYGLHANPMKTFPDVEVFIMAVDLTFHYNLIALVADCLGFPDERWINWLQRNIIPKKDKPFKALSIFLKQVGLFDKWFNDFSMDLNHCTVLFAQDECQTD